MSVDVVQKSLEIAEANQEIVVTIVKADRPTSQPEEDELSTSFSSAGALAPPYEPDTLITIFENSGELFPNVDAYKTNIDSFGHEFVPAINPDADDAPDLVFNAMFLESAEGGKKPKAPTPEEVEKKLETLRDEIAVETFRAKSWFETCCAEESFVELRRRTRVDLEATGNAYWEIIRDAKGRPAQIVHAPTRTMRMTRQERTFVEVEEQVRTSPLRHAPEKRLRRFRRYVQLVHTGVAATYFREYGDPRILSAKSGKFYESAEAMSAEEGEGAVEANEIIHFRIPFPGTSYGMPRWIGNLLAVLGNRQAAEVNFAYFDNKTVPPLALLVSGGRLSKSAKDTITSFIRDEIKGRQNFHKILIVEAIPTAAAGANPASQADGQTKIDLKPLTDAQQKDGLFLEYDERNADKVGMSFRLPRLLRGDVRDFNRATANAALEFSEQQVFGPERDAFDWIVNRRLMVELGFSLISFRSRGVQTRDPAIIAEIMERLARTGGLVPADVRRLAHLMLPEDLPDIDERWTTRPLILSEKAVVDDPLLSEEEFEEGAEELDEGDDAAEEEGAGEAEETEAGNAERGDAIDEESSRPAASRVSAARKRRRKRRKRSKFSDALVAAKLARVHARLLEQERLAAVEKRSGVLPEPDVELLPEDLSELLDAAEE